MITLPEEVGFTATWRPYQARVLKELEEYLDDERLHVVAAPGSGKTVLGIEVLRRINGPTLVLAPTLAIRDQWIHRFIEMFLPAGSKQPEWISRDLDDLGFFTVSTYQSLHAAMSRINPEVVEDAEEFEDIQQEDPDEKEEDELEDSKVSSWLDQSKKKKKKNLDNRNALLPELVDRLRAVGIKTLVLDEAHHLRSNWWKSLVSLIESIEGITLLSLTATPPFDVVDFEWDRYVELCGPVDAQIPVPELVMVGNLCPHQDLIVFSAPSEAEKEEISLIRKEVDNFIKWLQQNVTFTNHILSHNWIMESSKHVEDILSEPDYYSSMLIYLKHNGIKVSKDAIGIIADKDSHLPSFSVEWLEILLTRILYPPGKKNPRHPMFLKEVHDELKRIGAVELRRIQLRNVKTVEKILKRSISKLQRIEEIAQLEADSLHEALRMVVLTDYIRQESMPDESTDITPLNKIGVVPIFETLRRFKIDSKLGILCGSLVVIPKDTKDLLLRCTSNLGIENADVRLRLLEYDNSFLTVDVPENEKHKLVKAITDLFTAGGVNILVGTKSLLGEGWDAPSINSLIIASFVGSYMLSNQMRGRAIRSERGNLDKTANIWHLVCVEPKKEDGGQDFLTMQRRFKAFVGVSYFEPVIENGLGRIISEKPPFNTKQLEGLNERMFISATNRDRMKSSWDEALRRGEDGIRLVEDIQTKKVSLPRDFVFYNTLGYLFWEATFWLAFILSYTAEGWVRSLPLLFHPEYAFIVLAFFGLMLLIFTPMFLRILWLFIRHGPVASSLKTISRALLKTLCHIGEIRTDYTKMRIVADKGEMGEVFCHLEGGNPREKALFMRALQDILDPIENPRYIMVRKSRLLFIQRKDYHSVPSIIGAKKAHAEYFAEMWTKHVGKMNLVYTRNSVGRLELLKARNKSLSAAFRPKSERITRWK
ncbi:MAG: restriction endonuclease subunit R [Candidatus Thorarchaeota archaeon]|nr:MAG: restriction endonuclease subunit R [Candidatus Thorarchaeota archaeon]